VRRAGRGRKHIAARRVRVAVEAQLVPFYHEGRERNQGIHRY
jgi:hypothetical protein